jgi:DNA-directed RNA polymerase subunit L
MLGGAMEIELVEKDKNSIRIRLIDADMTIINPLLHELDQDETIDEVNYQMGHPELDKPMLYIRVSKGKPQTALKRAAKSLSGQFKDARSKLKKRLK